jgi:hypothetical protein
MNEEVQQVIDSTPTGVLATLLESGAPYATPITYTFKDGRFTWNSSPDAVHSKNIVRDGRVSLSIVEPVENGARAVYVNTIARATDETSYNEQWNQNLQVFEMNLGQLDTDHSTPGRFYFRSDT